MFSKSYVCIYIVFFLLLNKIEWKNTFHVYALDKHRLPSILWVIPSSRHADPPPSKVQCSEINEKNMSILYSKFLNEFGTLTTASSTFCEIGGLHVINWDRVVFYVEGFIFKWNSSIFLIGQSYMYTYNTYMCLN